MDNLVPRSYEFYASIMRSVIDGEAHEFENIKQDVIQDMGIHHSALIPLLPSKRATVFDRRLEIALKDLKKGGYIEETSKRKYTITTEGKELAADPEAVNSLNIRVELLMKENERLGEKIRQIVGRNE